MVYRFAFALAVLLAFPTGLLAEPSSFSRTNLQSSAAFMRIFGPTPAPYGFVRFCRTNPSECRRQRRSMERVELTEARLNELDYVNRYVNAAIKPVTDLKAYGVNEYWALPVDRGDCEDYALLKRRMLIDQGWPASSLLMTVVRDERGDGHAILTIRTSQGDYVVDNKNDKILPWNRTPYRFLMRQSYLDPNNWMSLDPAEDLSQVRHSASRK